MGPLDPITGQVIEGDIADQTRQTLKNLAAIIDECGVTFTSVVKVTAHLHNIRRDFATFDAVYREFFHEPYPVRSTVGSELASSLVSIDLVVAL